MRKWRWTRYYRFMNCKCYWYCFLDKYLKLQIHLRRERESNIWKSRYLLSSTNSDTLWVKQIRLKKKDEMGMFLASYYQATTTAGDLCLLQMLWMGQKIGGKGGALVREKANKTCGVSTSKHHKLGAVCNWVCYYILLLQSRPNLALPHTHTHAESSLPKLVPPNTGFSLHSYILVKEKVAELIIHLAS
jgi:hypothetical protein